MRSVRETKTLDPAATRQSILDAATALFSEKGFAATSMSDVASKAGVGKSLVLYHYSSKNELWAEVLAAKTKPFFEFGAHFLADDSDLSVRDLVRMKFETNRNDPDLPRLMAWMSLEPEIGAPHFRERARKVHDKIMSDPAKAGIPSGVDPTMFLAVVMSAVDGYFRFRKLHSIVIGSTKLAEGAEDAFFEVLMQTAFGGRADAV